MPDGAMNKFAWPRLSLADWQDSYATVHLWTQMLGKTRLALSPAQNHWWHTALYVTARGLTTSALPHGKRTLDVELDFIADELVVRTDAGARGAVGLGPRPVADVFADYRALLESFGFDVRIWPVPVEIEGAIPFTADRVHASYDPDAVRRCWQILLHTQRALENFRGAFLGKCSPAQFWWGAFDSACTRFSGRRAPQHPGGVPNLADHVTREAYSHECMSVGWWPGTIGGPLQEPAYYAYAYPEPDGFASATVTPGAAYYHDELREWILPYDAVRSAADPHVTLQAFFESTYGAAADLASWDRATLEREPRPTRAG
jgi:hypothetical protein